MQYITSIFFGIQQVNTIIKVTRILYSYNVISYVIDYYFDIETNSTSIPFPVDNNNGLIMPASCETFPPLTALAAGCWGP